MTVSQRNYFFGELWPKACKVQGWNGTALREVKRREVVFAATSKLRAEVPGAPGPTDSMSACGQAQLTAVFDLVKFLGDPLNLKLARRVENPKEAVEADCCERLLWKIQEAMKKGDYNYAYVQKIADWNCREAQKRDWRELPSEQLRTVLIHLNDRANAKDPNVQQRGSHRRKSTADQVNYQMKPRTVFKPKPKPITPVEAAREDDNIPY